MSRWARSGFLVLALLGVGVLPGCYFDTLPDPNASGTGELISARVMQRNIADAYARLDARVRRGEINQEARDRMIRDLVDTIAGYIRLEDIPKGEEWAYADVLRQAQRYEEAEQLYRIAVESAPTEDRRVNDSLQLARVLALQGRVGEAVEMARSVFDAPPREKAPIMMSVLYEIVPAGLGRSSQDDLALARLLEDAIGQHTLVEVDPELDSGKAFLAASPRHIDRAWTEVVRIYRDLGREDLMRAAFRKQDAINAKQRAL